VYHSSSIQPMEFTRFGTLAEITGTRANLLGVAALGDSKMRVEIRVYVNPS
jgi:hypothetical protein